MGKLALKRGKYGSLKFKAFSVLAEGGWQSSRRLSVQAGVGYYSIGRAFSRWCLHGYVERRPCLVWLEGDYEYRLLARGRSWLVLAKAELPNAPKFQAELKSWRAALPVLGVGLLELPFDEFVSQLHYLITGKKVGG